MQQTDGMELLQPLRVGDIGLAGTARAQQARSRRELADILMMRMRDPRLGFV